ncbi:MAG: ATP-binding cassette domain-containing protein [Planctomycetota bacterium]|nr:MAG: ATP-binding cassette domain-containing protein [Planctomycetota bacterium]
MPPTPRDTPVVFTKGLTKVFRDFWMRSRVTAVDHLDLEVRPGEIFGLLGPNGSGKSTTIKILLGLLHKTSGVAAVFGKPPSDVAVKERIGVLPEESYLYPYLNAIETLDYYGKLFEIPRRDRERRSNELLEMVGLASVAHRPIHEYSKGMQRRIGLAQALINDPEFLVLDEPTSGLDPIGAKQVKDLIVSLARRGKTVLLSSHQLSDVEDCVDRLVILYGGKKRAEGTCEELLTARDAMSLETDTLDEETITELERILAAHGHGLRRVAKPRQRLEDLFMSIVDQARAERLETGGAQAGGATAAFLVGEAQPERGERLIERLVADAHAPEPEEPQPGSASAPPPDEDARIIESLVADEHPEPESAATPEPSGEPGASAPEQTPSDEPDLGVIESLLSPGDEGSAADGEGRGP